LSLFPPTGGQGKKERGKGKAEENFREERGRRDGNGAKK